MTLRSSSRVISNKPAAVPANAAGIGRIVLDEVTPVGRDLVLAAVKAAAQTDAAFFPGADVRTRLRTELRSLVENSRPTEQS